MLRPDRTDCAACGAPLRGPACGRCGQRRYPFVEDATDFRRGGGPVLALGGAALGLYGAALGGLPGMALGAAFGVLGALGAAGAVGAGRAAQRLFSERTLVRAMRARAVAPGSARAPHATVRGRVRVVSAVNAKGAAAVAVAGGTSAGRFEIVDERGAALLCDDDALRLAPGRLLGGAALELCDGDRVVADGPVREIPESAGYRQSGARLAFDGTPEQPVRIAIEA